MKLAMRIVFVLVVCLLVVVLYRTYQGVRRSVSGEQEPNAAVQQVGETGVDAKGGDGRMAKPRFGSDVVGTGIPLPDMDPELLALQHLMENDDQSKETFDYVVSLSKSSNAKHRFEALEALKQIGGKKSAKLLIKMTKDADLDIGEHAVDALTTVMTRMTDEGSFAGRSLESLDQNKPKTDGPPGGVFARLDGNKDNQETVQQPVAEDKPVVEAPKEEEVTETNDEKTADDTAAEEDDEFDDDLGLELTVQESIDLWCESVLSATTEEAREALLIGMMKLSEDIVIPVLLNLLENPDSNVQELAKEYLVFSTNGEEIVNRHQGEAWLEDFLKFLHEYDENLGIEVEVEE
jgi:hypothetical protein